MILFQIPMLPDLINRLLAIIIGVFPVRAKELAVSCIGAVAVAVEVKSGLNVSCLSLSMRIASKE